MCCDNRGETGTPNGECEACGMPTVDGISTDICCYSRQACEVCENAPCDESC